MIFKKSLKIPEYRINTLKLIKKISEVEREIIIEELKSIEPHYMEVRKQKIQKISKRIELSEIEVQDLLDLIFELVFILYEKINNDIDEFFQLFKEAIDDVDNEEIKPENWNNYFNFYKRLFSIDSIALIAKSRMIISDHDHLFTSAKVYTDIRPVFKSDLSVEANAALLYHSLKINYHSHDSRENKSIYFALDKTDLRDLKDIIERALMKEKNLNRLFKKKDLILIKKEEDS